MFIAHNPNPELDCIGFRITDVDSTSLFNHKWSQLHDAIHDEYGGDLPLFSDEFCEPINDPSVRLLQANGITQVIDVTFSGFVDKIKRHIGLV